MSADARVLVGLALVSSGVLVIVLYAATLFLIHWVGTLHFLGRRTALVDVSGLLLVPLSFVLIVGGLTVLAQRRKRGLP